MLPRRVTWSAVGVVAGLAAMATARTAGAHIYAVKDPQSGVTYFTNAPSAAAAQIVIRELPRPMPVSALSPSRLGEDAPKGFDPLIREMADAYGVEYALVKAIIKAESGFNHRAISPKGARGLMQLMPATAAQHQVQDVFRPRDNIEGGVRHLRWLLDRYGGNIPYAVAAYNAGHQRVEEAGGIPNIPETREYLARVLRYRANYLRERKSGPGVVFVSAHR